MFEVLLSSNLESLCEKLTILRIWKTFLEDRDPVESLPLGTGSWDPGTPRKEIRALLLAVQMEIQQETDRLVEVLFPTAAQRCQPAG